MTSVDSEAFFDARMSSMGISAGVQTAVRSRGWLSLAAYAYGCGFIPGQSQDSVFVDSVLAIVVGVGHEVSPDSPRLRRLFFEAHTLAVQDLRRRSERTELDIPIRIPMEERSVRLTRLKRKYIGQDIEGIAEPSFALVDLLSQQLETGQIKYVPWTACTDRHSEVNGVKKLDVFPGIIKEDAAGFLKRVAVENKDVADTATDLLLVQALQRRSLAFELAGICEFTVFNRLSIRLLKELTKPPLHGYNRCTLEQAENADRYVFTRLADLTVGGLACMPDGSWPVATAMATILQEPDFLFLLMQMPKASSSGKSSAKPSQEHDRSRSRKRRTAADQAARTVANAAKKAAKGDKGYSKGKSKSQGKGKEKSGKARRFDPLIQTSRRPDGEAICFGFQDGSCTECAPGEKCTKGWHICWYLKCFKTHQGRAHQ